MTALSARLTVDGMPTKQEAREVLDTYIRAWETQDPDLIVTICPAAGHPASVAEVTGR